MLVLLTLIVCDWASDSVSVPGWIYGILAIVCLIWAVLNGLAWADR